MNHNDDIPDNPHSSPCYLGETDPAYHGFLSRDEALALLNNLLSAERAGAKICTLTLRQPEATGYSDLLRQIHRDEVTSCQGLINSIHLLGGNANTEVGDFCAKCMAIPALELRLQLLNKGQAWVVRKIREALPKIFHEGVRAQLADMLRVHEANIEMMKSP